jgi:hypothetical protein
VNSKVYFSLLLFSFFSLQSALALVTSPSIVGAGGWNVELKSMLERGKIEPNENRSSFQSAEIDVHQLSITKGLEGLSFGSDHFLRLDLKYFQSGEEQVAGQTFYAADTGNAATISFGFNFTHDSQLSSGMYISVSPITNFNQDKFSVPRIDLWSLGFRTSAEINDKFYVEDIVHYGSGIPGKQNSYLGFTHLFALRLNPIIRAPVSVKGGPYAELDTSERTDSKYDSAFSPAGTQDRIRSMKVGVISAIEIQLSEQSYGSVTYVQKLGGYDAPATNATAVAFGFNF